MSLKRKNSFRDPTVAKSISSPVLQKSGAIVRENGSNADDRINRTKKSFKRGPKIVDKSPPSPFLSHNTAERYRLYFELKNFEMSSKQRQIEDRLESLITEQLEANQLLTKARQKHHLPPEHTTLQHTTGFGAWLSDGLVYASGVRKFDFLLLDWRPKLKRLVQVMQTQDNIFKQLEVIHIDYFYFIISSLKNNSVKLI